jgi:hypothetical protein
MFIKRRLLICVCVCVRATVHADVVRLYKHLVLITHENYRELHFRYTRLGKKGNMWLAAQVVTLRLYQHKEMLCKIKDDMLLMFVSDGPFSRTYSQISQTVWTRRHVIVHQTNECTFSFFFCCCGPTRAMASSFTRFLGHTQRCTTVGRNPLDKWLARCNLSLTPHYTHNRHPCPVGILTHNLSRRAAADLRLRPRGHWDRHKCIFNA